jgi:hypothetical protein
MGSKREVLPTAPLRHLVDSGTSGQICRAAGQDSRAPSQIGRMPNQNCAKSFSSSRPTLLQASCTQVKYAGLERQNPADSTVEASRSFMHIESNMSCGGSGLSCTESDRSYAESELCEVLQQLSANTSTAITHVKLMLGSSGKSMLNTCKNL